MKKILVFAGTTEGRLLIETLSAYYDRHEEWNGVKSPQILACVATEYGRTLLLSESCHVKVMAGRLAPEAMKSLMETECFDVVVDTTHPYAVIVTENIKIACRETNTRYLRLLRERAALSTPSQKPGANERWVSEAEQPLNLPAVIFAADTAEAAAYLNQTQGTVLLTTGSKELEAFTKVEHFEERLYPRVLPMADVIKKCDELGYPGKHLICMQGPFSFELNVALLKQIGAAYLVTKDSGAVGGYDEKVRAAHEAGAALVVIGRRPGEEGSSFQEIVAILEREFGFAGLLEVAEQVDQPAIETAARGQEAKRCQDGETSRNSVSIDAAEQEQVPCFPLFVSLKEKSVLVIGGGRIAARRVDTLIPFGCRITVTAPDLSESLHEYHREGKLEWLQGSVMEKTVKGLTKADSEGSSAQAQELPAVWIEELLEARKPYLVILATDQRDLNRAVAVEVKKRNIPVNVIDCKEECTFYFPGIARNGALVAGVTASGTDHLLARKATEQIRACIAPMEER